MWHMIVGQTAICMLTFLQQPQVCLVIYVTLQFGLLLANFPCPALDLQLMGDH